VDLQEGGGGGAGAGAGGGSRERTVRTTNLEELEDALRCFFFFELCGQLTWKSISCIF
jgi:hypothetical protein